MPRMRRFRVLIGDDHPLILSAIRTLLEEDYKVVGTACDGRQLVDAALVLRPDLVILDVAMPRIDGFEAARQIRAALPSAKLIFVSMHSGPFYLRKAFEAGASAYILKSGATEELGSAIQIVFTGDHCLSPGLVKYLNLSNSGKPSGTSRELTDRQVEILQLIAEGHLSKEIAHMLQISRKTVDFHRGRIMKRLRARSTAEMVRQAVEQGLIPVSRARICEPLTPPAGEVGFPPAVRTLLLQDRPL